MTTIRTTPPPSFSPWVYLIALGNVALHLAFYNTLGFHRDELLYFSLGQHLSAGYASVPPFTGFLAWLVIHTLGYSLLAARIIPALLGGVIVILGAAMAREMKGKGYAQLLAAVSMVILPFNVRAFSMFQPVCSDIVFWSLLFWLAVKWINTKADRYLLLLGLASGVGLLNKYSVGLEILALFVAMLCSPHRAILKRKVFYLAILIGVMVFLPNIIWQVRNHFPVLVHMRALHDSQLVHVSRTAFLTDQLFLLLMTALAAVPGILFMCFGRDMRAYRPAIVASLLVFLALFLLRGKSYYTGGLFPLWIAAGSVWWESKTRRTATRAVLSLAMVALTLPVLPMGLPVWKEHKLAQYFAEVKERYGFDAVLRWETGRIHTLPQDYADMLGWDEIAEITSKAYQQVPDKNSVMIYAENYGEAGAVMVLGKKYGLPEPVCFSESFFYWFPRELDYEITHFIYINDNLGEDVSRLFAGCVKIGEVRNPLARECGTGVWLCSEPHFSFNEFWRERVPQVTSPFEH